MALLVVSRCSTAVCAWHTVCLFAVLAEPNSVQLIVFVLQDRDSIRRLVQLNAALQTSPEEPLAEAQRITVAQSAQFPSSEQLNVHLRGGAGLADDLQVAVFRLLQPNRPIAAHSPLRIGSLSSARSILKPVFAAASDRSLAVLAQRYAGALAVAPRRPAIVLFGEFFVQPVG